MTKSPFTREPRAASLEREHARDCARIAERYAEWCAQHGLTAYPATDRMIVRWIHSHYPAWSWGHAKSCVHAIKEANRKQRHPAPSGDLIPRYLQSLRRDLGTRKAPRTPAMTAEDIATMTQILQQAPAPLTDHQWRIRGAVALAWITGIPLVGQSKSEKDAVSRLPREAFVRDPDNGHVVAVRLSTRTITIDPERAGGLSDVLTQALDSIPEGAPPFAIYNLRRKAQDLLTNHSGEQNPDWRNWSATRLTYVISASHSDLSDRYRNTAAFLTGVALARRFQDLREMRIEDFRLTPDGVTVLQPFAKTDPQGQGARKHIPHARSDRDCEPETPCAPLCPVAAITAYLTHLRIARHITTGPFVGALRNGQIRPMTRKGWNHVLKGAWEKAGLPADRRPSSRSMRVSGVTLAKQAGASLEDIQRLTDHTDPRSVLIYVRGYDAQGLHIVLSDIDPDDDPDTD